MRIIIVWSLLRFTWISKVTLFYWPHLLLLIPAVYRCDNHLSSYLMDLSVSFEISKPLSLYKPNYGHAYQSQGSKENSLAQSEI